MNRQHSEPATAKIRAIPVRGLPDIKPGDPLPEVILASAAGSNINFAAGDILVVKHKIVSKAEGRLVRLDSVKPSRAALAAARRNHNDPRVAELALREAQ